MIRFGTDGWRAIIGEEFTYDNVRKVALAHAKVLKEKSLCRVIVGYDWRFSSERFALEVAKVFGSEGLDASLTKDACTTPMVSFAVKYLGFDSGVMITASHNPAHYNGYKIKESFGGSATSAFIKEVEGKVKTVSGSELFWDEFHYVEVANKYVEGVRSQVSLEAFNEFPLLIVHDAMHGTSRGLLNKALEGTRAQVVSVRSYRDPLFGGHPPEPVEKHLTLLKERVRALGASLGVANDGDGDRVAFIDEKGNFINSQLVYALLLLHLIRNKSMREGIVVKTVSTTYLANRICEREGIPLKEVPVGFKNINEVVMKERVLFGGEESGGYGFPHFLPERDGLLSALFMLEFIALKGKGISVLVEELFKEFGPAFYRRVDLPAQENTKKRLKDLMANPPEKLNRGRVVRTITEDGLKLVFEDDSWLLFRASGTEPLIRIYAEAPSGEELEKLLESGAELLKV